MGHQILRLCVLTAASVAAIGMIAEPLRAQTPDSVEDDGARRLQEIIVTARRREELQQDSPLAIDVKTGEDLELGSIANAYDLERAFPAVKVSNGGGANSSIFIRGVGSLTPAAWIDPAVSQSYDGIYLGRPAAASGQNFFDLERIEVLKGPQGTFYGRNATGGAINYIPQKPVIGSLEGYGSADVGNFEKLGFHGALNTPIGDGSAIRIAAHYLDREGYSSDGTDDANVWSIRGQLLTEPNDHLSIRLGVDFTDVGGVGPNGSYLGNYGFGADGPFTFFPSGLDIDSGPSSAAAGQFRQGILTAPTFAPLNPQQDELFLDNQFMGINAEINYNVASGTLTFIPAYRETDIRNQWIGPGFNSGRIEESYEQISLELRYASEMGGSVDYITGLFYFDEDIKGNNSLNQESVLPLNDFSQNTTSWAAFGQLSVQLSETVHLNLGVRYTDDEKKLSGDNRVFATFCGGLPGFGFAIPPASFALGCQLPGALPVYPTADTGQEVLDSLIANNYVAPTTTLNDPFFILQANGMPGDPDFRAPGAILNQFVTPNNAISEDETTYRIALEWDAAPDSSMYVAYERGYRAGGLQLNVSVPSYNPEYIDAFTIGSKNLFAGDTFQLNAEIFHWEYEDQQISYFTVNTLNALDFVTTNAGKSTINGVDVDLIWAISSATTVDAKIQYLDATYDELILSTAPPRDNYGCGGGVPSGVILPDGSPVLNFDCSGQQLLFAPEWAYSLGLEHVFEIGDIELAGRVDTSYRSAQETGFEYIEQTRIDGYSLTNLNFVFRPYNAADWSVTAYVLNVGDERYKISPQIGPSNTFTSSFSLPRSYGIRYRKEF